MFGPFKQLKTTSNPLSRDAFKQNTSFFLFYGQKNDKIQRKNDVFFPRRIEELLICYLSYIMDHRVVVRGQ